MTIKELDSRFTAAALESAAAADALGLDSRGLRALCEGHGAAAGLKRSLQRGQPTPLFDELAAAGRTALTLEALAVQSRFAELFTDAEADECFARLIDAADAFRYGMRADALIHDHARGDREDQNQDDDKHDVPFQEREKSVHTSHLSIL